MPPTDMPDVTDDVVNVTHGHTPCVTGDVVNVPPSHTSVNLGESDATGDVVNVQPSHVSAGGVVNTNPSQFDDKLHSQHKYSAC